MPHFSLAWLIIWLIDWLIDGLMLWVDMLYFSQVTQTGWGQLLWCGSNPERLPHRSTTVKFLLASTSRSRFLFTSDISVPLLPPEASLLSLLESSSWPGDLLLLPAGDGGGRRNCHLSLYITRHRGVECWCDGDMTHSDTVMDRIHTFHSLLLHCPAPPACPTWTVSSLEEEAEEEEH